MRLPWLPNPRLLWKLWLRRHRCIDSFCKVCGRTVHDFIAPDEVWAQVQPHIKRGNVLCYDCFCDLCAKLGLPSVWRLSPLVEGVITLTPDTGYQPLGR